MKKPLNPDIVVRALHSEEEYRSARKALAAHALECSGFQPGDKVTAKFREGAFLVQRAVPSFSSVKGKTELSVKLALKPRFSTAPEVFEPIEHVEPL